MKPTRKHCAAQIARLRVFPTFPKSQIAQRELVQTLAGYAKSDDHAKRVMDRAVREGRGGEEASLCPLPGDLIRYTQEVPIFAELPRGCAWCEGSGWRTVMKIEYDIGGRPVSADYASRCTCELGMHLRQADELRKEKHGTKEANPGAENSRSVS